MDGPVSWSRATYGTLPGARATVNTKTDANLCRSVAPFRTPSINIQRHCQKYIYLIEISYKYIHHMYRPKLLSLTYFCWIFPCFLSIYPITLRAL